MHVNKIHPEADHPLSWIAENIRFRRKNHGFSQNELAVIAGIPVNSIQKLESGEPGISITTLAMVFAVLDDFDRMTQIIDVAVDDIGLMRDQFDAPERIGRRKSVMNSFTSEHDVQEIEGPSP